jgi:hypothetical protein
MSVVVTGSIAFDYIMSFPAVSASTSYRISWTTSA